jgi:hypothetical protein
VKIDNTALKLFQACPLKFKTRMVDHWTSRFKSGALGYGGAVHEGLKAWYQGELDGLDVRQRVLAAEQAINDSWPVDHPIDDYRTKSKAMELMASYIKEYMQESFKVLMVEVPFSYEIGRYILYCSNCGDENGPKRTRLDTFEQEITSTCGNCGLDLEPIEYGGIFDTLVQYGAGSMSTIYILEHKTTSQLGGLYFRQYDLDNQISGYTFGAQGATGKLVGGAIVNALCTTSSGKISFKREIIGRTTAQIERWRDDVAATCNEIKRCERNGHWRISSDHCMNKYGLCEYQSVHVLANPDEQRRRLEVDYVREEWDFEKRDDAHKKLPVVGGA